MITTFLLLNAKLQNKITKPQTTSKTRLKTLTQKNWFDLTPINMQYNMMQNKRLVIK